MKIELISHRYQNDGQPCMALNAVQIAARDEVREKLESGEYPMEWVGCGVCGGDDQIVIAEKDRYGIPLSVTTCRGCGLIQTNPRMSDSAYKRFYESEYRRLYVGEAGPTERFFRMQERQGEMIGQFLDQHLSGEWSGRRVLEVGCGAGGILSHFRRRGAVVKGCDLGSEYLRYGAEQHRLDLVHGSIHDLSGNEQFDLIIYSHVFEHLTNPHSELQCVRDRLAGNGRLYIEIPGVHNIRDKYRCDFLRLLQNAHIFHFSLTSLNNLVGSCQFEMVAGDEFVRALYRPDGKQSRPIKSEYPDILQDIRRYERLRPINRFLPGNLIRVMRRNASMLVNRLRQ